MLEYIKTVIAVTFFFAILGNIIGPLFGYQQIISQKQTCYTATTYDNTFELCSAGVGVLVGLVMVYRENKRKKDNADDSESDNG